MSEKLLRFLALTLCLVMALTSLSACIVIGGTAADSGRDYCVVTFKIEDGKDRYLRIERNEAIGDSFDATRVGYSLEGWYTDETLSSKFDFSEPITTDTVLYGRWIKDPDVCVVTFDLCIDGEDDVQYAVSEGSSISSEDIPTCMKLGYEYRQWYVDEEMTIPWDFDMDVVVSDMTLYAEYAQDLSIVRNEDGSINFQDVTVNLYANWVFGTADSYLADLIEQFNAEYNGRIKIIPYSGTLTTSSQNTYSLRYQQISGANEDADTNYYTAQSVYELAGIEFDPNDWYTNAIRNCYYNGKLQSVPVVAGVPYVIYNRELMEKYNGTADLPSNYAELSALLKKAYEGESATNSNFKTFISGTAWPFRESTSMVGYLQNGAEYYVYENGEYINKWGDTTSEGYQGAVTALYNTYSLLGANGECHGGLSGDTYVDNLTMNAVISGDAFMGIVNVPETTAEVWKNVAVGATSNGKINVMPLSGLFAGEGVDEDTANQIPVHTLGFQFYKAKDVGYVELAAAAVFADYVSKNTINYAQNGWYPLNKTVTASDKFAHPTGDNYNTCQQIHWVLKNVGDPEDFRTLDGYTSEKYIINTVSGEQYMVTGGVLAMTGEVTRSTVEAQIFNLLTTIRPLLN